MRSETLLGSFECSFCHVFLYDISSFQNNIMNNLSGSTSVTGSSNTGVAALQVQKYLTQGGPHTVGVGGPQSVNVNTNPSVGFCQNASNSAPTVNIASNVSNQPSGQHIRMLGQQIQLAIHSGFISSQILTQPLTQTTLNLLNQLLSNIKVCLYVFKVIVLLVNPVINLSASSSSPTVSFPGQ